MSDINERGWTLLALAARDGDIDRVRALLDDGADPNEASENGRIPLAIASHKGAVDVARLLLDRGANPSKRPRGETSPLQDACRCWNYPTTRTQQGMKPYEELVDLLLERGAKPNVGSYAEKPLYWAARHGSALMVKTLLEHGADIDLGVKRKPADKKTLLEAAISCGVYGTDDKTKTLLAAGAGLGGYPLVAAAAIVDEAEGAATMNLLLDAGGDVNQATRDAGWTALHEATYWGNAWAVKLLLQAGADLHAQLTSSHWPEDTPIKKNTTPLTLCESDNEELAAIFREFVGTHKDVPIEKPKAQTFTLRPVATVVERLAASQPTITLHNGKTRAYSVKAGWSFDKSMTKKGDTTEPRSVLYLLDSEWSSVYEPDDDTLDVSHYSQSIGMWNARGDAEYVIEDDKWLFARVSVSSNQDDDDWLCRGEADTEFLYAIWQVEEGHCAAIWESDDEQTLLDIIGIGQLPKVDWKHKVDWRRCQAWVGDG